MTGFETVPLVSIGMPVYNGERTIHEALDSLLAQDFKDFELIISDNASSDNTRSICKMYEEKDSRVHYHLHETNIGPMANFNGLIHLAKGKYFMWAADDDWWEPDYISCMVKALGNDMDAVLSFSGYDFIRSNKTSFTEKDNLSKAIGLNTIFSRLLHSCSLNRWVSNGNYVYGLMQRDKLLDCGGLDARVDINRGADWVMIFHFLCYGKFLKDDRVLFHKRVNSDRDYCFSKVPIEQRLARQSFYSLAKSYLKWLIEGHQPYHVMRVIVKDEHSLKIYQRIVLYSLLYLSESLFYLDSLKRTFVNYTNYILKKSKTGNSR